MAERRRVALAEALEENEQLHLELDSLKSEVNTLKTENSMLKPLADEAEYLAGVLKVINCKIILGRLVILFLTL